MSGRWCGSYASLHPIPTPLDPDIMHITGTTRLFFCIADPIDQVRAPEVFNSIFARHGIDAAMVPLRVPAAQLEATLRALLESPTVGGVSLSIPHKAAATAIVDRPSAAARAANAVNAVRRNAAGELEGELFDGLGFMRSLDRAGIAYAGRRVLVIGAGGAASAVTTALAAAGVGEIALFDPDREKARQLAGFCGATSASPRAMRRRTIRPVST